MLLDHLIIVLLDNSLVKLLKLAHLELTPGLELNSPTDNKSGSLIVVKSLDAVDLVVAAAKEELLLILLCNKSENATAKPKI